MISQVQLLANGCQHFPSSSLFSCGTWKMRSTGVHGYKSSVWKACSVKIDDRRPSAGYKPSKWSHEYILSLQINHPDEVYRKKVNLLEENVRNQFFRVENNAVDGSEHLQKFEEIDFIIKLGLGHRFQSDINRALEKLINLMPNPIFRKEDDLYATALCFRISRQNGLQISQDVFKCYMRKNGIFDSTLSEDVKGMLALYEASHLAFDGEKILKEAKVFATLHLKNHLNKGNIDRNLANLVGHALELPLHRRVQRLKARWYIQEFHCILENKKNAPLIELARLDYNMVQAILQSDLQEMSRWWKEMGLSKLSFARDRLMECFVWAAAMVPEPHFKNCRKALTKIGILITIIDDVYDVYGSLDELELFTHAVERWDLNCINDLPEYMKLCFLALYNTINEMAFDVLKETGVNVTQLLAKEWADLCTAFLVEARWCHAKQMPSFDDYLSNGWLSVSGPLLLMHAFCLTQRITTKTLESYQDLKNFTRWPSTIFRLCNDSVTYSAELARGESASSVLCYMNDTGVSEAKACAHIRDLVEESWNKMNRILMSDEDAVFTKSFVEIVINLGRVVHCVYQHGDGYGAPDKRSKEKVMSLIINPISPPTCGRLDS